MLCSVYDKHNYILNFTQKLHLFSVVYFCMTIMMGRVREDILFREEHLGKPLILGLLDHARQFVQLKHQPNELVNQNGDTNEWIRRGSFLFFINTPFCQWIQPKSVKHIWCKQNNKHWVVPKLRIIVPKWDKRNNQRKLIIHFAKYWIRLTGLIILSPKIALAVQKRNQENHGQKERPEKLPEENELNCYFA